MPSEINWRFSITLLQSSQCLERTTSLEKLAKSDELRSKNVSIILKKNKTLCILHLK